MASARSPCRRTTGSQRRRTASRDVAKQHLKIRRQRRAVHFTTAKHAAEWYRRIGVEDGNVCQRVQHHQLATSRHDASGSAFLALLAILTQQAERAGHGVIRVPASPRASPARHAVGAGDTCRRV